MSFKFEFKIDYDKLTTLLDSFLKSHSDELTSIMGKCLVLQPSGGDTTPVSTDPIIDIPEDPLQNLFSITNNPTRYRDRNTK